MAQVVAEKASKNDLRPNLEPASLAADPLVLLPLVQIIQVAGNEFASLIEQSWHKEPNLVSLSDVSQPLAHILPSEALGFRAGR